MSFLDKLNRFATNPVNMNMKRSKFNLSHGYKTTFNSGDLIPILCDEVLPDDTIKIDVASVVRSITPAFPVMDNAYLDLFAFWVPARLCTVHEKDWQKIHGENVNGFWAPSSESTLNSTGNDWYMSSASVVKVQSLANYLTFPIEQGNVSMNFSRLPFNGYWEIYNEWFRDQNVSSPIAWKSFTNAQFLANACATGTCCKVSKFHDYFTSALPSPQKGASVLLPLAGTAPVKTGSTDQNTNSWSPLKFKSTANSYISNVGLGTGTSGVLQSSGTLGSGSTQMVPANLYADLANASAASVNDLRQAFAIQKLLEKDARGGTRYREMLKAHFGVSIPDNTVQVPEYLGGKRIPLNMLQVLQTAEGSSSPVGSTGAFSNTADNSLLFTKSFAEYGYIYILACVRPNQSYSQGISRMFKRDRRYDYYYPVFANLGEQAVKTSELYVDSSAIDDSAVFGYQEAWAEYRYKPTRITGYLGNGSGDSVAQKWTYSQHFASAPVLNSSFIQQNRSQMDNSFVVTNSTYQFIGDFWFNYTAWRAMPYFSIPGLIDHH